MEQRRSLLTVGVTNVHGKFAAGEVVQIMNDEEKIIGVAKVKIAADTLSQNLHVKRVMAAHADDIVLF